MVTKSWAFYASNQRFFYSMKEAGILCLQQARALKKLHEQAVAQNLSPENAHNKYKMRIDLR
jgi:hypothetical protein